jgi:hypothetical protein
MGDIKFAGNCESCGYPQLKKLVSNYRTEDDGSFSGLIGFLVAIVLNLVVLLAIWLAYFIYW